MDLVQNSEQDEKHNLKKKAYSTYFYMWSVVNEMIESGYFKKANYTGIESVYMSQFEEFLKWYVIRINKI